jgi:hypothetical protein
MAESITVYYDPGKCDWAQAIEKELKRRGIEPGKYCIIATTKEIEGAMQKLGTKNERKNKGPIQRKLA